MVTNFLSPYEPNAKMTTQSQPDPLLLNLDSAGGGVAANLLMQQRLAVLQTRQIGGSSDEASSSHEGEEEENDSDRGESPANGPTIKMDWSPSQGPNGTGLAPPMANGAQISPAGTNGSGRSSDGGGGTDGCNATDAEGVWSADIETAFQEALAIYPPCGRRKIILSDEGKMYGRNELIARYIKIRTGKTRTRKQVSSHIQVLARKRTRELQSKLKKGSSSGFFQDQTVKEKALQTLNGMSSAQIVSASAMHNRAVTQTLGNLYGVNTNTLGFSPPPNPFGNFGNDLDIKPSFAAQIANAMAAGYNMGQRQPSSTPGANYPPANPASLPPHNAPPAWEGRTISTPKIRLCDFSAYLEPSQRENTTEASSLRHELVRIGGNVTHVDHLLEAIDISQIYDKFPDKKGGLKDLFEKGPQNAFFLVKFWADITFNVPEEQNAFYAVDSRYESNEAMTIMVSTKVCSFGKQVVEKVETEYSHFNNGRFVFRIDRSPMCEYMINFVHKLKQLPEKYMMNSVLENFTILQVVINRETQETLLCIAFVFEVSDGDGSQHHVYKRFRWSLSGSGLIDLQPRPQLLKLKRSQRDGEGPAKRFHSASIHSSSHNHNGMRVVGEKVSFPSGCPTDSFNDSGTPLLNDFTEPMETDSNVGSLPSVEVDGCSPSLVMGCENRPDSLANEELPDISHSATAAAIPLGFHAGWDSPPNSIYTKANSSGGVTTTQAGVFPGFLHADSYSVSQGASTSGAEQSSFPAQDANLPIDVDTHNESQFRNYVGLVNQAMTCYLNSLLQTLFMTPEFRNALYKWEFQGPQEEESKCIPYQLQKLFVLLQTSDKSALETKELTRSFGWDSSHAWDQHDVQELCRVMFDALEMTWKHTDQADLITNLYQGTMKDYVKCLKCGKENAREDVFLDLPLAVRPFGSQEGYGSVEEALKAFVQPELLDGSNQYFCENCKQKCDAHKGLKITKFPYLLTIQLKRFDFDYTTLHRIKLNDRMSFPSILNLNPFTEERTDSGPNVCSSAEVDSAATTDSGVSVGGSSQSPTVSSTSAEDVVKEDRPVDPYPLIGHEEADDDDEGICLNDAISPSESGKSSPLPKVIEANRLPTTSTDDFIADEFDVAPELVEFYKRQGPNVYELFSIMIHSGSANGGHYYANMDSTIWWSFNDQHVSMVSPNDIKQSFGGKSNWGYSFSQANAYMLMYRQIAPEKNVHFVSDMKLPPNLLRILERSKEEELHRRLQEEYDRNLLKMNLFCYYPGQCVATEKPYQIAKSLTLAETTVHAYKFLGLDKLGIPFEQCRLIRYNKELFEYSFDAQDMIRPMSDIVGHYFSFDLLMEIVPSHVKFRPYRKEGNSSIQGITMKVYQIDIETESIRNPIMIRVVNSDTVQTLKELIAEYLQCDIRSIFAVLKGYRTEPTQLLDPTETFSSLPCTQKGQVFVEMGTIDRAFPHIPEDSGKVEFPALNTFYEVIDRYENVVVVKVLLPTATDYKSAGFSLGLDFQLENEEMETLSNATTTSELPTFVSAASLLQQHQNVQESDDQSCGPATTSTSSTKSSSFANSTGRRITPLLQPPASDNMSEYSTASDVSATFVTPTESSLPTPDSLSVNTAADQHSLPASAAHYNRPEEIVSPAPSSPSVRIPSPDLSSNMSSPCVGSPNVSPVVSNDGDKIMSYGMMGLLQERLGTDFPLSYDDQEVDHLDGLAEGIEHAEPRGRNLDLELLVEGLSRQSPSAFDRRQQTPHCVSPVASPEPAEGAGGLEPGSPTSVFEEEDRTSAKFNLPPPKSDWTYTADSTAQQTDEAGTSSDSEELKISESDEMSYFKAKEIDQDGSRYLEVEVDRRTPNYVLKHKLVPYVGVPADQFKLVKVYTAYECEWTNMHDQVKSLVNYDSHNSKYRTFEKTNHQLKIKLGRPLKKNEHLIKMFQFTMNDKEYCKELFDVTVKADTSLNQLKLEVKRKMLLHLGQSVPIDRIRIRTKNGIAPKRVLVPETFRKEDESLSTRNDELFVQILSEPECYTGRQDEVLMFCRRWKPDLLVFDPMKEILIPNCTNKEFMQLANAYNFPYETSKLELLESTKWYNLEQLQKSGYIATDDLLSESAFKHDLKDGNLFFYRDGSENPKTLTDQERKELQIKENARLRRSSVSTSVRRERALKIYTGVSPSLEEQDVD